MPIILHSFIHSANLSGAPAGGEALFQEPNSGLLLSGACTVVAADKGTTGGTVKQKPGIGLEPSDCPPVVREGGALEQTPKEGRGPPRLSGGGVLRREIPRTKALNQECAEQTQGKARMPGSRVLTMEGVGDKAGRARVWGGGPVLGCPVGHG